MKCYRKASGCPAQAATEGRREAGPFIVHDNLASVPEVRDAELQVLEAFLGQLLDELLADAGDTVPPLPRLRHRV